MLHGVGYKGQTSATNEAIWRSVKSLMKPFHQALSQVTGSSTPKQDAGADEAVGATMRCPCLKAATSVSAAVNESRQRSRRSFRRPVWSRITARRARWVGTQLVAPRCGHRPPCEPVGRLERNGLSRA